MSRSVESGIGKVMSAMSALDQPMILKSGNRVLQVLQVPLPGMVGISSLRQVAYHDNG